MLRTFLQRATPQLALRGLANQLASTCAEPATAGFLVHQDGGTWRGVALEICRQPGPAAVTLLTERLLAVAPYATELMFVTRTTPEDSVKDLAPAGACGWQPADAERPAQAPTRMNSVYLFIRTGAGTQADAYIEAVQVLFRTLGKDARILEAGDIDSLLAPWCAPHARSGGETAYVSLDGHDSWPHPLQRAQFTGPSRAMTLECCHLFVVDQADRGRALCEHVEQSLFADTDIGDGIPLAWMRASLLVCGETQDVRAELRRQDELRATGNALLQAARPANDSDILLALPWLRRPSEARARHRKAGAAPCTPAQLARRLPIPWGAHYWRNEYAGLACLRGRDYLGEPVELDPGAYDGAVSTLVLGRDGDRASVLAGAMLEAHLAIGGRGWILSNVSRPMFAAMHDTDEIKLDLERPVSLNPLAGYGSESDFESAQAVLLPWLIALAGIGDTDIMDSRHYRHERALNDALVYCWRDYKQGLGLAHILDALQNGIGAVETAAMIRQRMKGLSMAWFEGACALDGAPDVVAIDTSALPGGLASELLVQTILALDSLATDRADRRRRMLVVDSMSLLGTHGASRLLEVVLRRARLWGNQYLLNDQPFGQASETPHQRTAREQTRNRILMAMSPAQLDDWLDCKCFGIEKMELLSQLARRKECVRFVWVDDARVLLLEHAPDSRLQKAMAGGRS